MVRRVLILAPIMSLKLPEPDAAILARREEIAAALRAIVPGEGVIATERSTPCSR